jgi:hypothetical protein
LSHVGDELLHVGYQSIQDGCHGSSLMLGTRKSSIIIDQKSNTGANYTRTHEWIEKHIFIIGRTTQVPGTVARCCLTSRTLTGGHCSIGSCCAGGLAMMRRGGGATCINRVWRRRKAGNGWVWIPFPPMVLPAGISISYSL